MTCPHRQAEPVVLSTGERVACICIACLESVSADWIDRQLARALREAYCTHEDEVDISSFGEPPRSTMICITCSRLRRA